MPLMIKNSCRDGVHSQKLISKKEDLVLAQDNKTEKVPQNQDNSSQVGAYDEYCLSPLKI
jgi:hypothetical protein